MATMKGGPNSIRTARRVRYIGSNAKAAGFTLIELMLVVAVLGILLATAAAPLGSIFGQMTASREVRSLGSVLTTLRSEALRLRTPVVVSFSSDGYSWDIGADGSTDGTVSLNRSARWGELPIEGIRISGLGTLAGESSSRTIDVVSGGGRSSLLLNKNGLIQY